MEFWDIYDQYYAKVRKFILTLVKDEWVADHSNQAVLGSGAFLL